MFFSSHKHTFPVCFENCFESVELPEKFSGSTTNWENYFSWSLDKKSLFWPIKPCSISGDFWYFIIDSKQFPKLSFDHHIRELAFGWKCILPIEKSHQSAPRDEKYHSLAQIGKAKLFIFGGSLFKHIFEAFSTWKISYFSSCKLEFSSPPWFCNAWIIHSLLDLAAKTFWLKGIE